MRIAFTSLVILSLALSIAPSCDCASVVGEGEGEEGEGEGEGDNGVVRDPASHALFVGLCNYIERCPSDEFAFGYRNIDECADIVQFLFTCRITDVNGGTFGVEEHRADVTAAEASACVDFLDALPCSTSGIDLHGGTPCDVLSTTLSSDAPIGASCADDNCADGAQCASSADPAVCPVCVAELAEGAPCSGSEIRCRDPFVCGADGVCTGPKPDGASCFSTAECTSGSCVLSQCITPRGEGAACTVDEQCASRFCRGGASCETPAEAGQACAVDDDCRNHLCDASGLCGLPNASQCSLSAQCQSGYCDAAAGCVAPRALGGSCDNDDMCATKACDPQRLVCVLACAADDDCDGADRCDDGRCRAPLSDGSPCDVGEQCASGFCGFDDNVGDDRCATQPTHGGPCNGGFDSCLRSDRCVNGTCVAKSGPDEACDALDSCIDPFICIQGKCTLIDLQCKPGGAGDRCTYLRLCDDADFCDFNADITCAPRKNVGASCFQDEECLANLACSFGASGGACAPRAGPGASCAGVGCVAGSFCDRDTTTCRPLVADGAACNDDDECASGDCFIDTCAGQCLAP